VETSLALYLAADALDPLHRGPDADPPPLGADLLDYLATGVAVGGLVVEALVFAEGDDLLGELVALQRLEDGEVEGPGGTRGVVGGGFEMC
jgi:hypothetical protein